MDDAHDENPACFEKIDHTSDQQKHAETVKSIKESNIDDAVELRYPPRQNEE